MISFNTVNIKKRDGKIEQFNKTKIKNAVKRCFKQTHTRFTNSIVDDILEQLQQKLDTKSKISVEDIQDTIESYLMSNGFEAAAKHYIIYRKKREYVRNLVNSKKRFINKYKTSGNTADATIDDNSNVSGKNVGILNAEIHKEDNLETNRTFVCDKLEVLFPDFDSKQYVRDLTDHIIYKHDENSYPLPIPYCVAQSMYPFLLKGIQDLGGLSAAPKSLGSFCGIYVNMLFAMSANFLGAVATPEFLLYFTYFCKKEWGNDFYQHPDEQINRYNDRTIRKQIHQHFQQVVYGLNQPSGSRGLQSCFVNFAYYDKYFFGAMFGDFMFPDSTKPDWESLNWIQREFMTWFNEERLRCVLTFPVETFALVYDKETKKFLDEDSANFVAEEYAHGHSFFTYMSDTVDSLSSCCRLRNALTTKEFSFTNGNSGVRTGSVSVITLNLSRIIQEWSNEWCKANLDIDLKQGELPNAGIQDQLRLNLDSFKAYLIPILERIYKYHIAYKECLWDIYHANLLPAYTAGFIGLNDQYNTIGVNGLNQAAEWLGIECHDNELYKSFCQTIFKLIASENKAHSGMKYNKHKYMFNTELVPAESLAAKNYNWDRDDGYWVPTDTNLYASYVFKPNDKSTTVLEKIRLHGADYTSEMDGGMAAHINLDEHLSQQQYRQLLDYSAKVGCNYLTWNIPMTQCDDCGHITHRNLTACPKCGSQHLTYYTRIIGYLTAVKNWSEARRKEFATRIFHKQDTI